MDQSGPISRRRLLTVAAIAGFTGCTDEETEAPDGSSTETSDGDEDEDSTTESETSGDGGTDSDTDETDSDDGSRPQTDDSGDPDLREANVVGVEFEKQDGTYDFEVALHHDDDGEDGYANWWQVEQPDGTQLGRRELRHPHSQQPFTRSETIEIRDSVDCVVVRGHDQTHEYGGVAATVNLASGAVRTIDQGSEKQSFDAGDCPS